MEAPWKKFDEKLFEKAESAERERERQLGSVRSSDALKVRPLLAHVTGGQYKDELKRCF